MSKKLLLAAWIAGILFPTAWFSQQIPGLGRWFNIVFAADWTHTAAHAILYAVLAFGLAYLAGWERAKILPILGLTLAVGLAQEALQPLPGGGVPTAAVLPDLAADLAGGLVGYAVFTGVRKRREVR